MTVPVSWVVQNGIFVSVCLSFLLFFFLLSCIWAVTSGCGWVWFGLAASKHILFAHLFFLESSFFSFLGSSSASSFFCFVSVRSVRVSHVWQAEERAGF